MSDKDFEFVLEAQQGNSDAFAKLYSRTLKQAWFLALKLTDSREEAGEILKNAYADAFCGIGRLKRPEAYEAWMKQKVAGAYKATQSFVYSDATGDAPALSAEFLPSGVLEDEALCEKIEKTVASLPTEHRFISVLFYCVGMPVDFIAKFLGVSVSTVNSLLAKARTAIKESAGVGDELVEENALPVLTRIFHRSAADCTVDPELVRTAFVYAIDKYDASRVDDEAPADVVIEPVIDVEAAQKEAEAAADDTLDGKETEESQPQEEQTEEEQQEEAATAEMPDFFTVKIPDSEISEDAVTFDVSDSAEPSGVDFGVDIPVIDETAAEEPSTIIVDSAKVPSQAISGDAILEGIRQSIDDSYNDPDINEDPNAVYFTKQNITSTYNPVSDTYSGQEEKEEKPKKKAAKMTLTKQGKIALGVIALILVVVIAVIFIVAKGKKEKEKPAATPPAAVETEDISFKYVPVTSFAYADGSGVLSVENVEEISYFNEYCCVYKDSETQRFGLIDNKGIIRVKAEYYGFSVVPLYDINESYVYLAKVSENSDDYYEITFPDYKISDELYKDTQLQISDKKLPDGYSAMDTEKNGYFAVKDAKTGKWGYMNAATNELAVKCKYDAVNSADAVFTANSAFNKCRHVDESCMAAVKSGTKMGIICIVADGSTKEIVPSDYDIIMQGENGVYLAQKNGEWCYLVIGDAVAPDGAAIEPTGDGTNTGETSQTSGDVTVPEGCDEDTAKYVCELDGLTIRADHSKEADELGELEEGDEFNAIYSYTDEDTGKVWVAFNTDDGKVGWVSQAFITQSY